MSPLLRLLLVPFLVVTPCALGQDSKGPKIPKDDPLPKWNEDSQDFTYLRKITDRTFVHEEAKLSFTVPVGWKELEPQRLARKIDPRVSAVLRIEQPEKDVVASLYWIPMKPGQKMSEWVRTTQSEGEYGEEYETLKAVYGGPPRVTIPTKAKIGPFEVFRIDITGDPERGNNYDGVLYLFDVEAGTTTWLLKARISFPKGDREKYQPYALEVIRGYALAPDRVSDGK